jgi:uncharacterized protein YrrD
VDTTYLGRELVGKPLVSVTNGKRIAKVEDVLVDPGALEVSALVTSKGGLFRQEIKAVLRGQVEVWGTDTILVSHENAVAGEDRLPQLGDWLSVSDRLKGRDVVTATGLRIGVLDDVVIDTKGRLVEYTLSQVFVEGLVAELGRVPVEMTRSLGEDVLVLDIEEAKEKA